MDFCRTVYHVVQQGDTFYRLAQRYQTTVPDIIMRNPGINPYNLQVGTRLKICTGSMNDSMQQEEMALNNDMRKAWSNHSLWGAMFLKSVLEALPDSEAVKMRLLQNPTEIAGVFEQFYSQPMINQLKQLLTEYLELAEDLLKAMQQNNMPEMERVEALWYQNADKIARLLSSTNSKYNYEDLRRMLRMHLDMFKNTMEADMNGEHERVVELMDENNEHLMELADSLTEGLLAQFYQR